MLLLRRSIALNLSLVILLSGLGACKPQSRTVDKLAKDTQNIEDFDSSLTFNDVTLEQADEKGRPWWRVKAKQARYSKDQKRAIIETPKGELFQDGKLVFKVEAQQGEVLQDGKSILLKGKIVATDVKDGTVLKGNEVEWQPQKDVLLLRNKFTGTHRQMDVVGETGRFLTRARKLELFGKVIALAKESHLQIKTEQLVWEIKNQKVLGDRSVQIDRYKEKTLTERATATKAEVDIKAKIVSLKQTAQLNLIQQALQINSDLLTWNIDAKTAKSEVPVTILNPSQGMTMTANQGELQLQSQMVYLVGNVHGVRQKNQSELFADRANWSLETQQFSATGNVNYRQAEPALNLTGPQATGTMQDQKVIVTADSNRQVVTEIVPGNMR
jgi:LPS export ABC transporter protein LptC